MIASLWDALKCPISVASLVKSMKISFGCVKMFCTILLSSHCYLGLIKFNTILVTQHRLTAMTINHL